MKRTHKIITGLAATVLAGLALVVTADPQDAGRQSPQAAADDAGWQSIEAAGPAATVRTATVEPSDDAGWQR